MKKLRNKKVTLNDLAGMVQRGFLANEKRFDKIDEQFNEIDERFDGVDGRFDGIDKRLDKLEKDVKELKEDFRKILAGLDKVAKHYDDYLKESRARDAEMKRMKKWIEQIAQKVGVELVDY